MLGGGLVMCVAVCLLSPFQSNLQSSRPGLSVTAGPHSYKQGKVTCLIISTHSIPPYKQGKVTCLIISTH